MDARLIDHTSQLQQLLNKNAGKVITLPLGSYNVRTLTVPAKTQLTIGSGTTLKGLPVEKSLPIITLLSNVKLNGTGIIDGNKTARKKGVGVFINTAQNVAVSGIRVRNVAEQGIQIVASKNIRLANANVVGCGIKGVNQYQGINIVISQAISVTGCYVEDAMHGIQWWGDEVNGYCEDITINSNRVKRVIGGIWGNRGRRVNVSNNTTEVCQDVGVDFEHSFNCSAIGNTVRDCKNYGLAVFYGSERITFARNRVFQGVNYGHGIGICGEGLSKQISFIGGTINTKGLGSCGLITVGTNVGQDVLVQGMSIVTEGKNGMPIRVIDNNQFQIVKNPLIASTNSTGISLEGSSKSLVEANTIVHRGTDSSKQGERGGVFVFYRSAEYPAQQNVIRNNTIRGFSTGINDECWGDVNSQNKFENNIAPNLFHRSVGGNWGGQAVQNRTESKVLMPVKVKAQ